MTIHRHINELIEERNRLEAEVAALRAELARVNASRFQLTPRVVVQAATPEEAAQVAAFLIGKHNLSVVLEVISADVAEENKRLRDELAKAEARVKTLQTNLLGIAGLGAVYANEED